MMKSVHAVPVHLGNLLIFEAKTQLTDYKITKTDDETGEGGDDTVLASTAQKLKVNSSYKRLMASAIYNLKYSENG